MRIYAYLLISLDEYSLGNPAALHRGFIVSPTDDPRFVVNLTIFPDKGRSTQLRILKPDKENSRGSPELSNQNMRRIVQGVPEF